MPQLPSVVHCQSTRAQTDLIVRYADRLKADAHTIAPDVHGMTQREFEESALFRAAVERIRGQFAATTNHKREYLDKMLRAMKATNHIADYEFTGSGERHDYAIDMPDETKVSFEAKGCLDGNNTNIFIRPAQADEFYIWSLCQNAGANPRKNVWSGIHVRLGAQLVAERVLVNGLIVWDMLCGTRARPCPKGRVGLEDGSRRYPPPCLYIFPRSIPDPRNNPTPPLGRLEDLGFFSALYERFHCTPADVFYVEISVRHDRQATLRQTRLLQGEGTEKTVIHESDWDEVRRANV